MTPFEKFRKENPSYDDMSDGDLAFALRRKYYPDLEYGVFAAQIGLSKDQRRAMLSAAEADGQELSSRAVSNTEPAQNVARNMLQGMTFGAGDEIVAAGAALGDKLMGRDGSWGDRYEAHLMNERGKLDQGREASPIASIGSEIGGALAVPGALLRPVASPYVNAARATGLAAGGGVLYGFNAGRGGAEERLESAKTTGLLSAAIGGAGSAITQGVGRVIDGRSLMRGARQAAKAAPDNDELHALASAAYKRADQAVIPRAGLTGAAQKAAAEISPNRLINRSLTPKTASVLDELTDVATDPNPALKFGELEDVRKLTRVPRADFTNPAEQRGGGIIAGAIDEFVDAIDPALSKEITEARSYWSTLRKNELIMEAVEKAGRQASGFENGLRIQFRQILGNKKLRGQFTDTERKAMEQVVQGTRLGNVMKKVGKLGFGRGAQTNVLGGTAGVGVFGPVAPMAGEAALTAAEGITARRARLVQDIVRSGGLPQLKKLDAEALALLEEMGRRPAAPGAIGLLHMSQQ